MHVHLHRFRRLEEFLELFGVQLGMLVVHRSDESQHDVSFMRQPVALEAHGQAHIAIIDADIRFSQELAHEDTLE
jgi:hypothetical protein